MGYIYGLICPLINEVRYIGLTTKSLNERKRGHFNKFYKNIEGKKSYKDAWFFSLFKINKLNDLKIEIIEVCENDLLYEREKFWIEKYRSDGFRLTNLKDGGLRPFGHKIGEMPLSHKTNISLGLLKYWSNIIDDEQRISKIRNTKIQNGTLYIPMSDEKRLCLNKHMSLIHSGSNNPFYGKKHSDESKEKIRLNCNNIGENNPFYNRNHTIETKNKLSITFKNKLVKPIIVVNEQGKMLELFTEVDKIKLFLNINNTNEISRKVNKNLKYKGYYFYHNTKELNILYEKLFNENMMNKNKEFINSNNILG